MSLNAEVERLTEKLAKPGPIAQDALDASGQALGITWPDDYRSYMLEAGGGEGWIGDGYLALWPANELVETNLAVIKDFAPNLVGIGTNGGGELFAYDTSKPNPVVVMAPSVDLGSPIEVGSFRELLRRLATDQLFT